MLDFSGFVFFLFPPTWETDLSLDFSSLDNSKYNVTIFISIGEELHEGIRDKNN